MGSAECKFAMIYISMTETTQASMALLNSQNNEGTKKNHLAKDIK